ncbi:DUF1868 domain-containing protein [Pantanalinema rosaneae CENA516]|uniref:DUF1868 domain-containing protein n=1 Tax=Pantanalinema rosaneae TaxID=1620701 RepID=UPI003D6F8D5B
MDENYQTYLNRAIRMILPETYQSQVQHIQESPKFRRQAEQHYDAVPFPGYSIVTPPGIDETDNLELYKSLADLQQQLLHRIGGQSFIPVPADSFHVTVADLIWNDAFRDANQSPDYESKLRSTIAKIFQECQPLRTGQPIRFQVLGLLLMTRAIGVCLAPTDEDSYDRILKVRRALYQNHELMGLGIEQQYYFTPHVTLGYFGEIPPADARQSLSQVFIDLNQQWLDKEPQDFWVRRAELRKFADMTRYDRESDWAVFEF